METLILSVFITNKNLFIMNLLTITLPIVTIAIIIFVVMFVLNVKIWYYHIDVVLVKFSPTQSLFRAWQI